MDLEETLLPGVGVRYELQTRSGGTAQPYRSRDHPAYAADIPVSSAGGR